MRVLGFALDRRDPLRAPEGLPARATWAAVVGRSPLTIGIDAEPGAPLVLDVRDGIAAGPLADAVERGIVTFEPTDGREISAWLPIATCAEVGSRPARLVLVDGVPEQIVAATVRPRAGRLVLVARTGSLAAEAGDVALFAGLDGGEPLLRLGRARATARGLFPAGAPRISRIAATRYRIGRRVSAVALASRERLAGVPRALRGWAEPVYRRLPAGAQPVARQGMRALRRAGRAIRRAGRRG